MDMDALSLRKIVGFNLTRVRLKRAVEATPETTPEQSASTSREFV